MKILDPKRALLGLALLAGWVLHGKLMKLGGPMNYIAPE